LLSYERSNYTLLNFVGDIGALFSTLSGIASFILTLFNDTIIKNHLINEIFKERSCYQNQLPIPIKITFYDWFKQVPHSICPNWRLLKEHRLTKLRKVGLRRIERELDISRFIRK
jgi:hypothetical protein